MNDQKFVLFPFKLLPSEKESLGKASPNGMPKIYKISLKKYPSETRNTKSDKTDGTSSLENRYFYSVLPKHTYLFCAKGAECGLV